MRGEGSASAGQSQLSSVFFGGVGPIHWETYLREAYASLRGVKGSLRGGVLFGVAYAGGYARTILSANLQKSALRQLWLTRRRTWGRRRRRRTGVWVRARGVECCSLASFFGSCFLQSGSCTGQQRINFICRLWASRWLGVILRKLSPDEFVHFSRFWSLSLPTPFTLPKANSPCKGIVRCVLIVGPGLNLPMAELTTGRITEKLVGNTNSIGTTLKNFSFQAISAGDQEVRALEKSAGLRPCDAGVEFDDMELWALRICIDHVLRTLLVARQKIINAVNSTLLEERLDPSTPPSKETIDWTFSVLFTKKVQSYLQGTETRTLRNRLL